MVWTAVDVFYDPALRIGLLDARRSEFKNNYGAVGDVGVEEDGVSLVTSMEYGSLSPNSFL
jgi:hypothetical protein